jgi:hypothetical protein
MDPPLPSEDWGPRAIEEPVPGVLLGRGGVELPRLDVDPELGWTTSTDAEW